MPATRRPAPSTIPAPGTYHFKATYSGNDVLAESASDPAAGAITVDADFVEAQEIGVSAGSIYPVKDGYRDTVTIHGDRLEAIAVSISIYNAGGKRVKLVSKSSATGGYSYVWNGRDAHGDVLPEGKYRIAQKLTDTASETQTVTSYVTLSKKKLVTRDEDHHEERLRAGRLRWQGREVRARPCASRAAAAPRLPGGSSRSRRPWSTSRCRSGSTRRRGCRRPASIIAMQNFNLCGSWNTGCFDRFKGIGNSSGAAKWYSTSGSPSAHRNGLTVRGLVGVVSGTVYVHKAEIKVTYQVLK